MDITQEQVRLVESLRAIKPGERITYYEGLDHSSCPTFISLTVDALTRSKLIAPVRKRVEKPTHNGAEDFVNGIGSFTFIAIGLPPPKG